jgi:hypothetical protein
MKYLKYIKSSKMPKVDRNAISLTDTDIDAGTVFI